MEDSDNRARGLRRFGLRIVTLYFTEEQYEALAGGAGGIGLGALSRAIEVAERVVIDDDVVKDRYPSREEGDRFAAALAERLAVPVTVTAPEGTVGMIPTVPT